jgi:hypothetical protein
MINCYEAARRLPGYLDGAIHAGDHTRLREHLASCGECRNELERYRVMATCLANVEATLPPPALALQIRIGASQLGPGRLNWARWWSRAQLFFKNILEPLAVPATGGVLTALAVFVLVVQNILVGVPLGGAVPNDLPLNLVQPAQLEKLAPFPILGIRATEGHPDSGGLLLVATLNAQGEVVCYKILSGPNNSVVKRQVEQVLLFSQFRPELSFGLPRAGGRVFLSFSEVHVRG